MVDAFVYVIACFPVWLVGVLITGFYCVVCKWLFVLCIVIEVVLFDFYVCFVCCCVIFKLLLLMFCLGGLIFVFLLLIVSAGVSGWWLVGCLLFIMLVLLFAT